jgi:hypothetical protein
VSRRILSNAKRTVAILLRGGVFFALASKLLVPPGYMPSAIADGGPIRLCDVGLPATLVSGAGAGEHIVGAHEAHANAGALRDRDAAAHDHGAAAHDHDGAAHDQGGRSDKHHEWEHCPLGGLASLAAIADDWQIALPYAVQRHFVPVDFVAFDRQIFIAFRSRAPPRAFS